MTVREYALRQLHGRIQNDPWVQEIFLAGGDQLDQLAERILALYHSEDFEAMAVERVRYYEKLLGIQSDESMSLADRQSALQARWKSAGKVSLSMIESIAHSWVDGEIAAYFIDGRIRLVFESTVSDATLWHIRDAIEEFKPAHLPLELIRLGWLYSGEACAGEF